MTRKQVLGAGRVVFVNRFFHPDHSATSQMLSDLAFALAAGGRDVAVVTSRQSYEDARSRYRARETVNGVRVIRVWTTHFGRGNLLLRAFDYLTFYLSTLLVLLRDCRADDVIVAKTDPPMVGVIATTVAAMRGCKTVNWLQDVFPEVATVLGVLGSNRIASRSLKALRDSSLKRADLNVVLGRRMAERIESCGVAAAAISVIPNWADGNAIRPIPRNDNSLRREWDLGDRFIVGYSGNLGRAHDYKTLLQAAEGLRDNDGIAFVIIGGGAGYDALRRKAKSAGMSNIRCLPYQPRDRLAEVLSLPDLHVISLLPALEGLIVPSKLYGVMAAGRPMLFIGDPDGEAGRVIRDSGCGWQIAPGDGSTMTRVILEALANPGRIAAQGNAGRTVFAGAYDFPLALDRWDAALSSLMLRREAERQLAEVA